MTVRVIASCGIDSWQAQQSCQDVHVSPVCMLIVLLTKAEH